MLPSKHIVLVIVKKLYCKSYNVLEELETEVTFFSVDSSRICTSGIVLEPGLLTSSAFDNFDRYIDSVTVKDTTLNDTVGIVIQNIEGVGCSAERIDNVKTTNPQHLFLAKQKEDALLNPALQMYYRIIKSQKYKILCYPAILH